jgi:hypothetical protein
MSDYELYRAAYRDYAMFHAPSFWQEWFGIESSLEPPEPPPAEPIARPKRRKIQSTPARRVRVAKKAAKDWSAA